MNIVITAGGTGGHIFPALSVAIELKKQRDNLSLLWIGTSRSREKELGEKYNITVKILNVSGMDRKLSFSSLIAFVKFIQAAFNMHTFFRGNRPDAVIAFGGYVCAPVLAAARLCKIPYFLHEQNSVPGLVNRIFSTGAKYSFLGYPICGKWKLRGKTEITRTPVRTVTDSFNGFQYPENFDRNGRTILICGGSQGAASMNDCLIEPVKKMLNDGLHVFWQTGDVSYGKIVNLLSGFNKAFVFKTVDDLYPYYAVANIVICRSGASTLSEIAYFGLPSIMIPLPWSAENHQWINAGHVEKEGWGVRITQGENCGTRVEITIDNLLSDKKRYEKMRQNALDNSPDNSASIIVRRIIEQLR